MSKEEQTVAGSHSSYLEGYSPVVDTEDFLRGHVLTESFRTLITVPWTPYSREHNIPAIVWLDESGVPVVADIIGEEDGREVFDIRVSNFRIDKEVAGDNVTHYSKEQTRKRLAGLL